MKIDISSLGLDNIVYYAVFDAWTAQFLETWFADPNNGHKHVHSWCGITLDPNTNHDYSIPLELMLGSFQHQHTEAKLFNTKKEAEDVVRKLQEEFRADGTPEEELDFCIVEVRPRVEIEYVTEPVIVEAKE